MQIIFHIDLNAFYASAEMANDSSLEGKPLVISGNTRRAIVSTASYEARKLIKINCTLRNLMTTMLGCVWIGACCLIVKRNIENQIIMLGCAVLLSASVYALILYVTKNSVVVELIDHLKKKNI